MVLSTSSSSPLAVVTGATGVQGGSVVKHLLESTKEYRVRAVTRDPSKPAGVALASRGIEVVAADYEDIDALKAAFAGADYVFVRLSPLSSQNFSCDAGRDELGGDVRHREGSGRWSTAR